MHSAMPKGFAEIPLLFNALLFSTLFLTACAPTASSENQNNQHAQNIPIEQCTRLALIDEDTGNAIIGAEDLAIDHTRNILFVSAYDRKAAEKKAKKSKTKSIPTGGLYRIDLATLPDNSSDEVKVKSLIRNTDIAGGLRPHGITYDRATNEIIYINRGYFRTKNKWKMKPSLERVGADGAMVMAEAPKTACAANDISTWQGEILVSFDHAHCNWRGGLEDIFSLRRSGVIKASDEDPLFDKVSHANGIIESASGDIVLAATREKALYLFKSENGDLVHQNKISLPGGPDNLTTAYDGAIIAAVHPSLVRMGAHRKLGLGKAPSRIVRVDTDTGVVTPLFDDPDGSTFSAATVGVETQDVLILGSVTDTGLLVCQKEQ